MSPAKPACAACGRVLGRVAFQADAEHPADWHCVWCAVKAPRLQRTASRTMLVVGTLLAGINHGSQYLQGHVPVRVWAETGLTYLVPYGVSMWSGLAARRVRHASAPRES